MKITSRIDAYLTNATFPWEKQAGTHVTVGALLVYKITRPTGDFYGEWKFDRLWVKSFPVQTNVMKWDSTLKLLAIGMDDGKIHCLKISPEHKYMQYEEVLPNIRNYPLVLHSKNSHCKSDGIGNRS